MSARPQTKPATGTDTVTVACKIPQGLTLQLHELRDVSEVGLGSTRTVKQFFPYGEPFVISGSAHAQNEGPKCRTVGAFAITHGVPKELWEKWMEQTGRSHPAVINGMLFAFPTVERVETVAKERRKLKTGLERLNPHDLPVLHPMFPLKTADENVAEIGHVEE